MNDIKLNEEIILLNNEEEYNNYINIIKLNNLSYVPFIIIYNKNNADYEPILSCFGENRSVLFSNTFFDILPENYKFDVLNKEYVNILIHYEEALSNYLPTIHNEDYRNEIWREIISNNDDYEIVYKNYPAFDYSEKDVKRIDVDYEIIKIKDYKKSFNNIGFNLNFAKIFSIDEIINFITNNDHNIFFCLEKNNSYFESDAENKIFITEENYEKIAEKINNLKFFNYLKLNSQKYISDEIIVVNDDKKVYFLKIYGLFKIKF